MGTLYNFFEDDPAATTVDDADLIPVYDASAARTKYTTRAGLMGSLSADVASNVGAVNAATGLSCTAESGPLGTFRLTFTFTAVTITVTDAAGSGSSGSLKIFDFVQGSIMPRGIRQNWTAFAEGASLTTGAGDAAFVIGFGSVAANAGDGALTGTEVDFGAATSTITLSGGTGTGTVTSGVTAAVDGTATAADLYINWSGTAATIDATSTINVTGTVTIVGQFLGDD
jgi:hypothetical protein